MRCHGYQSGLFGPFRGGSGTRLRTPFGAHLERPESSFGVESELNCGRIGVNLLSGARFFMQLISQLNSISRIDNSALNSTELYSHFNSAELTPLTQLTIELNSVSYSTQLNSNQITTQFNSTQITTQRHSALNETELYFQLHLVELIPSTQLTIELNSTHN